MSSLPCRLCAPSFPSVATRDGPRVLVTPEGFGRRGPCPEDGVVCTFVPTRSLEPVVSGDGYAHPLTPSAPDPVRDVRGLCDGSTTWSPPVVPRKPSTHSPSPDAQVSTGLWMSYSLPSGRTAFGRSGGAEVKGRGRTFSRGPRTGGAWSVPYVSDRRCAGPRLLPAT